MQPHYGRRLFPFGLGILMFVLIFMVSCQKTLSVQPSRTPNILSTVVSEQLTKVVLLVTSTPLVSNTEEAVGATPHDSTLVIPSTPEAISTVIGQIIPFPGQDYTNLRSEPNSVSEIITKLQAKQNVFVIGRHFDPPWWEVSVNGLTGWVYTDYVFIAGDLSQVPCIPASSECKPPLSQENYEKGVSAIRQFMQLPNLLLSFQEITNDPNANLRQVMIFADAQGSHYYVDLLKFQVVEYLTEATPEPKSNGQKEMAELRALAVKIASQSSSIFHQKGNLLNATENVGNGNVAFRWDDMNLHQAPIPFLQIVLSAKGDVINYINTLDVLEN